MDITFLSGLPRTGSTLLTSILSQNPALHTQGNSAMCQLMWDMQVSCQNTEQIENSPEITDRLISAIPNIFYKDIDKHIIDKCRTWTLPANLELIDKYITKSPKIIVMLRPVVEIVKSFIYIRTLNGWEDPEYGLLDNATDPIMRPLGGVLYSRTINEGQFLYLSYKDLISSPQSTIDKIYDFCGWERFQHKFKDIHNPTPENDSVLNMLGLHDIRPTIEKRKIDVELSESLLHRATLLDKELLN